MYVVHTGLHVTRRKQMNAITDHEGDPVWTGARIFDALQWLVDNEIYEARIDHGFRQLRIMLGTVPE